MSQLSVHVVAVDDFPYAASIWDDSREIFLKIKAGKNISKVDRLSLLAIL